MRAYLLPQLIILFIFFQKFLFYGIKTVKSVKKVIISENKVSVVVLRKVPNINKEEITSWLNPFSLLTFFFWNIIDLFSDSFFASFFLIVLIVSKHFFFSLCFPMENLLNFMTMKTRPKRSNKFLFTIIFHQVIIFNTYKKTY